MQFELSLALGIVVDLGLVEVVSSAGAEGISSAEIGERTGIPKGKAAHLLRLLAGRGVFREVRPDIWVHTRHSVALDSGLPYETIVKEPRKRYAMGSNGYPAWVSHLCDVGIRTGLGIYPAFRNRKFLTSYSVRETPFMLRKLH